MVPASPLHSLSSSLALVAAAAVRVGLEQPGSAARVGDVGVDRLPVLRRRDGRRVLHRRLGDDAWQLSELGVGDLAALAIGVGEPMLRLSAAAAAMIMVFMVSLHLPASPSRAGHCLRQGECPFAMPGRWVSPYAL